MLFNLFNLLFLCVFDNFQGPGPISGPGPVTCPGTRPAPGTGHGQGHFQCQDQDQGAVMLFNLFNLLGMFDI